MKLYNLLGDDIISKGNFLDFVDALQETPEATGHIIFFGQAEKFCDFIKWDENIYHKKEAKVLLFIFFRLLSLFQNFGWQCERVFHDRTFSSQFPRVFLTFITMDEISNDNLSGQSIRSSRNPRNNMDNDSYKAEDCFNLNKSVVLHQDTTTKTYFMVRQNSYKITSKGEHERMKHF